MPGNDGKEYRTWVSMNNRREGSTLYQSFNSGAHHFNADFYSDFSFLLHMHRDLEFVWVLEGEVDILVDDRTETARKGDIALFTSHQMHGFRSSKHSKTIIVTFSEYYVKTFVQQMRGKIGKRSVFSVPPGLSAYLSECYLTAAEPCEMVLKASLYSICAAYLQAVPMVAIPENDNSLLDEILTYIEKHYRDEITLQMISHELGYNPSYISRYFNQMVGINMRRFINQYRIEDAISLMNGKQISIMEIAFMVGFQNVRSFNREFKTITGKVPSDFL